MANLRPGQREGTGTGGHRRASKAYAAETRSKPNVIKDCRSSSAVQNLAPTSASGGQRAFSFAKDMLQLHCTQSVPTDADDSALRRDKLQRFTAATDTARIGIVLMPTRFRGMCHEAALKRVVPRKSRRCEPVKARAVLTLRSLALECCSMTTCWSIILSAMTSLALVVESLEILNRDATLPGVAESRSEPHPHARDAARVTPPLSSMSPRALSRAKRDTHTRP